MRSPAGNPELEAVLNGKMYYTSMAAVVEENFIRGRHSIRRRRHSRQDHDDFAHGMGARASRRESFVPDRGVAENFNASFHLNDGRYFVIEGDEYDTAYFDKGPKFMHYLPDTVILNNVEFDHADIYRDMKR